VVGLDLAETGFRGQFSAVDDQVAQFALLSRR
jgi:hypothetical protein